MALSQSALLEVLDALKASDSTDVIRNAVQLMLQQLIDAEATAFIGAEPHQRTEERITQRNGTRAKTLTTAAGDLDLLDHQAPPGYVLPLAAGTTPPDRPGAVRGDHGGLRHRRIDAQGRRPGQGPGRGHRYLQVRGLADLRRPRRAGRRFADRHSLGDRISLRVPRRDLLQGPRRWRRNGTGSGGPRRSWSPPVSPPTGAVRSSGSRSVTPRTVPSGPRSCAACKARGLDWNAAGASPMPTPASRPPSPR